MLSWYVVESFLVCLYIWHFFCCHWDIIIKENMQRAQVKRLYFLLTIKDSAANIPRNLEARRRLQFFTNSLFMEMPVAKPVREMLYFRWYFLLIHAIRNILVFDEPCILISFYVLMQRVHTTLLLDCPL